MYEAQGIGEEKRDIGTEKTEVTLGRGSEMEELIGKQPCTACYGLFLNLCQNILVVPFFLLHTMAPPFFKSYLMRQGPPGLTMLKVIYW